MVLFILAFEQPKTMLWYKEFVWNFLEKSNDVKQIGREKIVVGFNYE